VCTAGCTRYPELKKAQDARPRDHPSRSSIYLLVGQTHLEQQHEEEIRWCLSDSLAFYGNRASVPLTADRLKTKEAIDVLSSTCCSLSVLDIQMSAGQWSLVLVRTELSCFFYCNGVDLVLATYFLL